MGTSFRTVEGVTIAEESRKINIRHMPSVRERHPHAKKGICQFDKRHSLMILCGHADLTERRAETVSGGSAASGSFTAFQGNSDRTARVGCSFVRLPAGRPGV